MAEVYVYQDVQGLTVQAMREMLAPHVPAGTYIGSKYDETHVERSNHIILNIGSAGESARGALRNYTVSGVIVSPTRAGAVELNELAVGAMKALPTKLTILKDIQVSNAGSFFESGDGQKYMRGFNLVLLAKANKKISF